MCVLVEGTWMKDVFVPYRAEGMAEAINNIQRFVVAFANLHNQWNRDWDTTLSELGILDSLMDSSNWVLNYERIVMLSEGHFTKTHYDSYCLLMAICKHIIPNGELIWNNRTVLLDRSEPADWLVSEVTKK